jgi:hypothetical protein
MFQKARNIAVSLIFLISTSGITLHKHYSDGELFDFSIFGKAKSCCETNCGCCKDETVTFQLHIDVLGSAFQQVETPHFNHILQVIKVDHLIQSLYSASLPEHFYFDSSPPTISHNQALLQNFLL